MFLATGTQFEQTRPKMSAVVRLNHLITTFIILSYCQIIVRPVTAQTNESVEYNLVRFKSSLKDVDGLYQWALDGSNACTWDGIVCNDNIITGLNLTDFSLSGDTADMDADALTKLTTLRKITLSYNNFTGRIPAAFGRMASLRSLYLSGCHFSGEIPSNYFKNITQLVFLDLSNNNFSGRIPSSLTKLKKIEELSLGINHFTGIIPDIRPPNLHKVDFSHNNLEGKIPVEIDKKKFGHEPFDGNPNLCGESIEVPCEEEPSEPPMDEMEPLSGYGSSNKREEKEPFRWTKLLFFGVIVSVLVLSYYTKKPREENEDDEDDDDNQDHMHFQELGDRDDYDLNIGTSSRYGGEGSKGRPMNYSYSLGMESVYEEEEEEDIGSSIGSRGDLVMVNEERGVFGMRDLLQAAAEHIGSHGLGSTYKSSMGNGVCVVVKRFTNMNRLVGDEFEDELRRFGAIRHPNVLTPLAFYYQDSEKLLVNEYVPRGSLFSILHGNQEVSRAELDWPTRRQIIKGIARGMGFLHTEFSDYVLPHGNLKSSNILLSANNEPLLTDFAMFHLIGDTDSIQRSLFAYKCPEALYYHHLSPKSDVYCLGIVVLEILTGEFPSQYLDSNEDEDGLDLVELVYRAISVDRVAELIDPEISCTAESLEGIVRMFNIAASCVEADREKRIEMGEAIRRIYEVEH